MNPRQLRYLIAIDEAGSVRAAARALGVSQAGVSEAVQRLEASVGQPLVVLAGRRLQLTTSGRRLATKARPVLAAFDELVTLNGESEDFRVLAPDAVISRLVPAALTSVDAGSFRLTAAYSVEAVEILTTGQVDAAVMAVGVPHAAIEHHDVGMLSLSVFGRADLFGGRDVRTLPFVAAIDRSAVPSVGPRAADAWPARAFQRTVRYGVSNVEAALQICGSGAAAAYLPAVTVDLWNEQVRPELRLGSLVPVGSRLNQRVRMTLARPVGARESPHFWQFHAALRELLG